ncbi:alpha/beta fold hydrolase BchO [uncultured Roseovarius sp.]|uniref:alpha/beta fold hydrolase BchO n=1 Tax=uncultured Roseovarius sp. TaxID=293344 RepID=UPI0025FDF776|nr:alpha/beta fold hydrolase BchO [uncultured Roseovarius sp.]
MDWARDLPSWPNHETSKRLSIRPHEWHIQEMGTGPTLLLLHGAGASTHSWRDILPYLAKTHHVVALDLPGQGFTRAGSLRRCGLDPMAEDIATLCEAKAWNLRAIIGHSAGAAIALRLSETMPVPTRPDIIFGLNPALGNFQGIAGWMFPIMAKFLALNPLTSYLFAGQAPHVGRTRRIIESTGSQLDDDGLMLYARLIADRDHVEATLQMMAQWQIDPLLGRLNRIETSCHFITGARDRAVPPETAQTAAASILNCRLTKFPGLGHLAHEEAPEMFSRFLSENLSERPA